MLNGHTQLVFLGDAPLIPRDIPSRNDWLVKCFDETTYIKDIIPERPLFTNSKGTDACFKRTKNPCKSNKALIGDAALALDPLSGSGTWMALQSAKKLLSELLSGGMNAQSINTWHHKAFEDELKIYYPYYYEAAKRFPDSMFWAGRLKTVANIYMKMDANLS
jgi:flavin-dependent dehydrogenase